jgi:hypothetical protein
MKLTPVTCTACPAVPLDGMSEEIAGAAPGVVGRVVVVVVVAGGPAVEVG